MCVYETGLLLLFAYIALLLLPLSFVLGVGAPSLSLAGFMLKAARRGSLSLFVVVLFGGLCVRDGLATYVSSTHTVSVCVLCRTSAASVEPLPRVSRAVAFTRWLRVLSCSTPTLGGANRFASMMTNTSPNHRVIVSAVRCAEEEEADGLAAGAQVGELPHGVGVCTTGAGEFRQHLTHKHRRGEPVRIAAGVRPR